MSAMTTRTKAAVNEEWIPPRQGEWTIADYMRLENPPGYSYELVKGVLHMSPSPSLSHQRALMELATRMFSHVRKNKLGEVIVAPMDVEIDVGETQTIVEPDIIFVSNARREILTHKHLRGAPDLLVEILSPGSEARDRNAKLTLYMTSGVREYWIVDPHKRTIEIWVMREMGHVRKGEWIPGQAAHSEVLEGFTASVEEICAAP